MLLSLCGIVRTVLTMVARFCPLNEKHQIILSALQCIVLIGMQVLFSLMTAAGIKAFLCGWRHHSYPLVSMLITVDKTASLKFFINKMYLVFLWSLCPVAMIYYVAWVTEWLNSVWGLRCWVKFCNFWQKHPVEGGKPQGMREGLAWFGVNEWACNVVIHPNSLVRLQQI